MAGEVENGKVEMAIFANDLKYLKEAVARIEKKLEENFVSKTLFETTVKNLELRVSDHAKVLWAVGGIVATTIIGSVLRLVIK